MEVFVVIEFRQLTVENVEEFSALIKNMYEHLENLEWFSPMPFDHDNVKGMIEHPRFYIVGAFEDGVLCGVTSLDYKCGKLIGKVDFPDYCNTDSLVEIGFNMVHSDYRGKGIMKQMVSHILEKVKLDGFGWAFAKVHKDNFASSKSLIKNGFEIFADYHKPVKVSEFVDLSSQPFFSPVGKENAKQSLARVKDGDENLIVEYDLLIKTM